MSPIRRKVQEIVDGDTFKVRTKVNGSCYIRIAGEDAPEKGEKGYTKAKNRLRRKLKGEWVNLNPVGKSYGRTVARVSKTKKKKGKKKRLFVPSMEIGDMIILFFIGIGFLFLGLVFSKG